MELRRADWSLVAETHSDWLSLKVDTLSITHNFKPSFNLNELLSSLLQYYS